jgi:hypothetical protein
MRRNMILLGDNLIFVVILQGLKGLVVLTKGSFLWRNACKRGLARVL